MPDLSNEQEQNQDQEIQDNQDELDTTQTTDDQNNQPAAPATPVPDVQEIHNLYRSVLAQQTQERQRLEQELNQVRNQQNQPQRTPEQDVELLTSDPRRLIREELESVVNPLRQDAALLRRTGLIEQYKTLMKTNPNTSFMNRDGFMPYFDNMVSQIQELNDNSVYAAYLAAVGAYVQSPEFNRPAPNNQPTSPTSHSQTVPTPPSPRTAPPQRVTNPNNKVKKTYSENELLLMRINKMTPEQWEAELALAPSDVVKGPGGGN